MVQLSNGFRERNHINTVKGIPLPNRLHIPGPKINSSKRVNNLLDMVPILAGLAVNLQVYLILILSSLNNKPLTLPGCFIFANLCQSGLYVHQVHVLVLKDPESLGQPSHALMKGENNSSLEINLICK